MLHRGKKILGFLLSAALIAGMPVSAMAAQDEAQETAVAVAEEAAEDVSPQENIREEVTDTAQDSEAIVPEETEVVSVEETEEDLQETAVTEEETEESSVVAEPVVQAPEETKDLVAEDSAEAEPETVEEAETEVLAEPAAEEEAPVVSADEDEPEIMASVSTVAPTSAIYTIQLVFNTNKGYISEFGVPILPTLDVNDASQLTSSTKIGKIGMKAKRVGYDFNGWYTSASGGQIISESTPFSVLAKLAVAELADPAVEIKDNIIRIEVYAHWKKSAVVTAPKIKKVTSGVKSGSSYFKVTFNRISGAKGYEVRYSRNPNMKNSKKKTLSASASSLKVTKASYGIYFVQVRAYKVNAAGKNVYSKWSQARLAKFVKYKSDISEATMEKLVAQAKTNKSKKAILYALSRVGYPYSQALRHSGKYYDCSSLVYYAWKSAGVKLSPVNAATEAKKLSKKQVSVSKLKPGALIFYSGYYNGRYKNITHVAMYVGNGMIVDAANTRKGVVYRKMMKGNIVVCCDPMK